MNTIKIRKKQCELIAHRGLSGLEKENTAAAFIAAGNRKSYFGCECDIHPTKDGIYVICHDEDLNRVGGVDIHIHEHTYQELLNYKLVCDIDKEKKDYFQIVKMSDYIKICKKYDKYCVIEYKENFTKEQVSEIIDEIKELDYLDKVIFISFYPNPLIYTREILPNQPMQFLIFEYKDEVYDFCKKYNLGLDSRWDLLNQDIIDKWHELNLKVNAWTVNDKKRAYKLIRLGIDFITTNILE